MDKIGDSLITVLVGIIGLATVAVLVGKNAQTSKVVTSFGKAFSDAIKAAVAPVT